MGAHHNTVVTTPGHENSDASVRLVVVVLAFLAGGTACVCFLVYGIFRYLADNPLSTAPPNPMANTSPQQQFPPAPRLQIHASTDLRDLNAQEDQLLSTYGWTDKNAGIVRVPIDRAMDLALERGFATKPASSNAPGMNRAAPK